MAVLYAVEARVATITLDRPHRLNAYDVAMRDELWAALGAAADDPQVRVAVLRGAGAAFCTGGDLAEFVTAPSSLVADFAIAATDARFRLPEVGLGMIPGVGGTQTLPRAVGLGRAAELVLTRRWLGAAEALAMGIVTRVVAPDALVAESEAIAAAIARLAPALVRSTRRAVCDGLDLPVAAG